ncbi:hypothetical protein N9D91_03740 [Planktomarina temperata]|nr:hypothetical protein [Planktomarina temperata]
MNKEPKPKTSLDREELLKAMEPIRDLIPEDNYDQFLDQVYSATEIYLDLDEPSIVAKELSEINRICGKPNRTLLHKLGKISKSTRELLDGKTPLPPLPNIEDEAGIAELATEIRQRIIVWMKPKSDRMGYGFIAKSKAGRPSKQRLRVLVSFTTAAYVNATGKEYRRQWDSDDDLPFHQILEKLFCALGIKASIDEAIRRQQIPPR